MRCSGRVVIASDYGSGDPCSHLSGVTRLTRDVLAYWAFHPSGVYHLWINTCHNWGSSHFDAFGPLWNFRIICWSARNSTIKRRIHIKSRLQVVNAIKRSWFTANDCYRKYLECTFEEDAEPFFKRTHILSQCVTAVGIWRTTSWKLMRVVHTSDKAMHLNGKIIFKFKAQSNVIYKPCSGFTAIRPYSMPGNRLTFQIIDIFNAQYFKSIMFDNRNWYLRYYRRSINNHIIIIIIIIIHHLYTPPEFKG